ncbi:MAG: hypothetical protein CL946_04055, partial [Ectothiorhodospiraceae bacterium]|nr:hypothetical protein [Ectothiorhodospiraceae bacterium]
VPPAKAATYEVTCSAPPELIFDDMTGRYIPDPFSFRVTVTNTGESAGRNLELSVRLHQRLTLEGGTNLRAIPSLAPGESITVEFFVRPVAKVVEALADLCASVVDENGNNADCCTELRVAAATTAFLDLGCSSSVDSLVADTQRGGYENAPFDVTVAVTNNGERLATNVTARLTAYGNNDLLVLPPIVQPVADQLASGESMTVSWQVNAVPLAIGGDRELRILVSGDDLPQTDCIVSVYVPAVGTPVLDCNVLFMPEALDDGVLHFDMDTGDFEGRRSPNGNYSVFDLRTVIYNVGDARANDVAVTVLPPDGVTLDEPNARKDATPGDIQIGASGEATFRFRPVRLPVDMMRAFRVQVSSRNATAVYCVDSILVQGADRVATLRIPGDQVGQYGDKLYVPVFISPTIAAKVQTYRINVQFDPDIVQFYGATNEGTLTQHGWNGPRHSMLGSGLVRIEDLTTGSPLATREEGVLVYLIFEAVYGSAEQEMNYAQSALSFIAVATVDGNTMLTTLNSFHDDKHGDIALNLEDGMVTVSGECIVPLQGGAGFALEQNQPNPFNPVTRISYTLAKDTRAKLTVYDALGREVRRLVDEPQAAGQYTVLFDASGLPSGTYIYKLETTHHAETKRMVLTR